MTSLGVLPLFHRYNLRDSAKLLQNVVTFPENFEHDDVCNLVRSNLLFFGPILIISEVHEIANVFH